jgi:hypothetical protein
MVTFLWLQCIFMYFNFYLMFSFLLQITNKHKYAYMHTYVSHGNDLDLRKFRVAQDIPERNDLNRGASVERSTQRIKRYICYLNEKNTAYNTITFPVSQTFFLCE